ncbi:hypothetical protein PAECIP111892_00596 [Paenibacillus auburnensis]|uniref:Uncharacterized protein n=1 Tax=Paenibacillus auburnensis TaxID=2905649 RepID=A0ABM9BQJ6_9BACL|nr:DUF6054 family protein [Paenibacillus auburnensis]CAH1191323.1 hypothetical protein PAECIP111892_00596 [Paenibacillus auburnensis]
MNEVFRFDISLQPDAAITLVRNGLTEQSELLHQELHDLGDGRMIGTLVYERYYLRAGNQAALVVIVDNFSGVSKVRLISAGSSNSMVFKFDWGAGKSFASSVEKILSSYILK